MPRTEQLPRSGTMLFVSFSRKEKKLVAGYPCDAKNRLLVSRIILRKRSSGTFPPKQLQSTNYEPKREPPCLIKTQNNKHMCLYLTGDTSVARSLHKAPIKGLYRRRPQRLRGIKSILSETAICSLLHIPVPAVDSFLLLPKQAKLA